MQIKREEQTTYYYEASERIGNVDLYFEEHSYKNPTDADNLLIISLRTNRNEHQQNCIRLTRDEFIQIMPDLKELYEQLLTGSYKL